VFVVEPVVKNKLEKLQLEAARIVTGLPIFTKTDSLYFEIGWEPLHSRHHRRKLQLFYSRLRTEFSSVFHSLTEEGMNDKFVEESLQKGGY
jgi:hypothetical protein